MCNDTNKANSFNFKIYSPNPAEYDGGLYAEYRGLTEEDEPCAVLELKLNQNFLMKYVNATNDESFDTLKSIIKAIEDKRNEIQEKKEILKEKEKVITILKEFWKFTCENGYAENHTNIDEDNLVNFYYTVYCGEKKLERNNEA